MLTGDEITELCKGKGCETLTHESHSEAKSAYRAISATLRTIWDNQE